MSSLLDYDNDLPGVITEIEAEYSQDYDTLHLMVQPDNLLRYILLNMQLIFLVKLMIVRRTKKLH